MHKAQGSLGVCYYEGDGVAMNKTKAVEWFQKAAEQGCIQAKEVLESITQHIKCNNQNLFLRL